MEKIDKRKNYYMVIDTETCPIKPSDEVSPYNMLVYDIGFIITDKKGNIYETGSYIVEDIFINEPVKMRSAYYYDKMPQYIEDMIFNERTLETFSNIRDIVWEVLRKYDIKEVYAHNMFFDNIALKTTGKYLYQPEMFFPIGTMLKCTMRFSECSICQQKMYKEFCKENNYMTNHNPPRTRKSAEILYRYIIHDTNFVESHTALEDCMIEKEILTKCFAQHKKKKPTILVEKVLTT